LKERHKFAAQVFIMYIIIVSTVAYKISIVYACQMSQQDFSNYTCPLIAHLKNCKSSNEPGSEKIALKWKSSIWIFWFLKYLFVMYANERYTKLY